MLRPWFFINLYHQEVFPKQSVTMCATARVIQIQDYHFCIHGNSIVSMMLGIFSRLLVQVILQHAYRKFVCFCLISVILPLASSVHV
jgi:hypothetical protein